MPIVPDTTLKMDIDDGLYDVAAAEGISPRESAAAGHRPTSEYEDKRETRLEKTQQHISGTPQAPLANSLHRIIHRWASAGRAAAARRGEGRQAGGHAAQGNGPNGVGRITEPHCFRSYLPHALQGHGYLQTMQAWGMGMQSMAQGKHS